MFSWFDWSSVEEFASNRNRMSLLSSGSVSSDAPPPDRIGAIATFCSLKMPLFSIVCSAARLANRLASGGSLMRSLP